MFELLIYMFENYLSSKSYLDFNNISMELEAAGFDNDDIEEAFDAYWGEQKLKAFNNLCEEEKLEKDKIQSIIEERLFSNQVVSFNEKVDNSLLVRDTFLKRKKTVKRVIEKIMNFIETFAEGLAA